MSLKKKPRLNYITTKGIFYITLLVIFLTILSVWQFGLGKERTIIENSILSTTILSLVFFLFITIGLYNGIKLKDNLGKITDRLDLGTEGISDVFDVSSPELPDFTDGIEEMVLGILLWILITIIIGVLLWLFGGILWTMVLIFLAMLYWIFFRALRLVFKKSPICKGNLVKSMGFGLGYTLLYNFWIYIIIVIAEFLKYY
ncbi:hypothetical protein [uncultured Aquimarina sp.]|uniref:hypothetical protein n=1 Tax=uncultured Aquimarina sp. TaxID=575652 RepID=UPI0026054C20|nr:hypothetical protein [uncultured Aquimarina sp.]